jgi:hypothetical protein
MRQGNRLTLRASEMYFQTGMTQNSRFIASQDKVDFSPQWQAIQREAQLAAEQLATGVTALGRANHAQRGLYAQAFFALSIGLERLAKLIVVADYAITHCGSYPTDKQLRGFGHDIVGLLARCEQISSRYRSGKDYAVRPNTAIHEGIVTALSEFGELSRYHNLDFLVGGKATAYPEPIAGWWARVGRPILDKHYSMAQRQRDEESVAVDTVATVPAFVLHHAEDGTRIDDVATLMQRAMATNIVQKFGRLYTLQIIRWLAFLITDLADLAAYKHRLEPFFGIGEAFELFRGDEKHIKNRKRFSIYIR